MFKSIIKLLKKKLFSLYCLTFSTLYRIGGNYHKAIFYLDKLTRNDEVSSVVWWKLGNLLGIEGHWAEAKKAFLQALRRNKRNPQYLYCLGKIEENSGNAKGAISIYDQVLKHQENSGPTLLAKGNLLMKKGNFGEAVPCFYKLMQLEPHNPEIYNNIGLCQLQLNQLELAECFFEKAFILKPKDVVIVYNYGMVMLKKGYYEKAIEVISKLIVEDRVEIFSSLGYCYSFLGKYAESLTFYKKALQIAPHYQENLINLACTYAKMGENGKALEILKKLLRVNPYDVNLLNNIAWIYENLKNYGEAEQNYYRGLALAPQDPHLMYNLICCLHKQNKHCEAMEMIALLKKIPEWSSMAWSSLAHIYEKMGEKNLAVDCYNKALGLN